MTTRKFHGPEKLRHVSNFTAAFWLFSPCSPTHPANGININCMSQLLSPCIIFNVKELSWTVPENQNQKSHKNLFQGNVNGRFLKGVRKNLRIFRLNNTKINLISLSWMKGKFKNSPLYKILYLFSFTFGFFSQKEKIFVIVFTVVPYKLTTCTR